MVRVRSISLPQAGHKCSGIRPIPPITGIVTCQAGYAVMTVTLQRFGDKLWRTFGVQSHACLNTRSPHVMSGHAQPPVDRQSEKFELAMLRLRPVNVRYATSAIQD